MKENKNISKQVHIFYPQKWHDIIEKMAKERSCSISGLIRTSIREFLIKEKAL